MSEVVYQTPRVKGSENETVVTSTCGHNCGGRCVVNAHVVDGRITKISTQSGRWNPHMPPLPACARGIGQVERTYHPDRLLYPVRRTGPRGSGHWEQIDWDEALDEVAAQLVRVREAYGNEAILDLSRSGSLSMLHGRAAATRFMNMFGGATNLWSNMSAEAEVFSVHMTYGANMNYKAAGREPTDYVNSKLIVMWGWSPGDGTFGTGTMQYLKAAKRAGTKIICIDPRRTRTSATLADEHIFIRPSTDTAALLAIAYVLFTEELVDEDFCHRYVQGHDEAHLPDFAPEGSSFRSYVLGLADGQPKTPEWAAPITGIDATTIRRLALEMGSTKPMAMQTGYAPGRTSIGEQFHRAAYAIAALTGNVGIEGGNSGSSNGATGRNGIKSLPTGTNPCNARVSTPLLADLLEKGTSGGYPADIKLLFSAGGNLFNQCPNVNKMVASLDGIEFFAAVDNFLTPTTRYADIVLPATTFWERNDVHTPWAGAGHYAIYMKQAIERVGDCRDDLDIFGALAQRVGIDGYNDKTEDEWLREFTAEVIPDFEAFKEAGLARMPAPKDAVAFASFVRDPTTHPLTTPSGKIEIYSTTLGRDPNPYGLGDISPIPTWRDPIEANPRYPFAVCSPKSRARTHSIHGNQPKLARVDKDDVWIHPHDAACRGITSGDQVRVFNDLGATELPAKVTDRIAPGVISIKEGAWYTPNGQGVDTVGCGNVLSADTSARCGATTYNTNHAQVEKV